MARTAYWLEWWRRFGSALSSDPKLADPFGKYVIATFVYGSNRGSGFPGPLKRTGLGGDGCPLSRRDCLPRHRGRKCRHKGARHVP